MVLAGTDHQRIAKLDRENEVAPPAKVAPSVGKVCVFCTPVLASLLHSFLLFLSLLTLRLLFLPTLQPYSILRDNSRIDMLITYLL